MKDVEMRKISIYLLMKHYGQPYRHLNMPDLKMLDFPMNFPLQNHDRYVETTHSTGD